MVVSDTGVKDVRDGPPEEYWDRFRAMMGPEGLITYWYLGRAVNGLSAGPRGEDVAAVVVPSTAADLRTADLAAHARQLLSSFKVPRHWLILADADVPMTATGKPDIQALRARFAGRPVENHILA
jgi:acyl-CoA synthetase (AMP-forming)/AMP-acid ligase II